MSAITSKSVRSIIKFGFGCLAVDGLIELATSYEAKSAYEFAYLTAIRKRARAKGHAVEPMTNRELMKRARCNVGGYDSARYNLRKHGEHTVLMTITTFIEDGDCHYVDTMRQVTVFDSVESAKVFIESMADKYCTDTRLMFHDGSWNDVFIPFDGDHKPNAWTDAVSYKYEII